MLRSADGDGRGPALALFALTALAVAATWAWLGAPVAVPPSPLGSEAKLWCVSYAPFRGDENPLVLGTYVPPAEIDGDLALLAKYTGCVRTYSVDFGLDKVPELARKHGLKVLQGLWLSGDPEKNRLQIATTIALAKTYSDVISGIVVGNEVLLRGDMSAPELEATIRQVKAQVSEPVTYADVWEYWLRYRDLASAVDFVTIHILPYWEDFPLPARLAAAHVDDIRQKVAEAIPGKDIVIGEFGWPSAGRMREGARPSPSNEAKAIDQTLALAQREHFHVNVIEAFDQPWKRWLEGSVGGRWGIFDRATGAPKFPFAGGGVSDHADWPLWAGVGILLTALLFGTAWSARRAKPAPDWRWWAGVAGIGYLPAILLGWTLERIPVESYSAGGWLRSLVFAAVAVAAPILCVRALAVRRPLPPLAALFGGSDGHRDWLMLALGTTLAVLMVLALQAALGLVFNPRYRDIPFAPLTAAVVPLLALSLSVPASAGLRAAAERVAALLLAAAAVYVAFNETFANWQAIWFAAALLGFAFILARVRDVPG